MSDCRIPMPTYNAPTHSPAEDELRVIAHFKDGLPPKEFVANRDTLDGLRVLDYLEHDGERYERVSECVPEWDGKWFRCGCCGERLDRFGVRTTNKLNGEIVREIAEPPRRCPNCGAKVKVGE